MVGHWLDSDSTCGALYHSIRKDPDPGGQSPKVKGAGPRPPSQKSESPVKKR